VGVRGGYWEGAAADGTGVQCTMSGGREGTWRMGRLLVPNIDADLA
jgi:hypothetical protein